MCIMYIQVERFINPNKGLSHMGIRSDVALGMTLEVYEALSEQSKTTIKEWCGEHKDIGDHGILFVADDVKWYADSFPDLIALYEDLHEQDFEQFHLIVATPEYPNNTDLDTGDWYDNPWEIYKYTSCELRWEHA